MANSKTALRKEIGNRMRALRRARGLSIDELATQIKLTPSHLGLIERGERGVTVDRLIVVCQYFGCSADFMLTGREAPAPKAEKGKHAAASIDLMLNDAEREKLAELIYLMRS